MSSQCSIEMQSQICNKMMSQNMVQVFTSIICETWRRVSWYLRRQYGSSWSLLSAQGGTSHIFQNSSHFCKVMMMTSSAHNCKRIDMMTMSIVFQSMYSLQSLSKKETIQILFSLISNKFIVQIQWQGGKNSCMGGSWEIKGGGWTEEDWGNAKTVITLLKSSMGFLDTRKRK